MELTKFVAFLAAVLPVAYGAPAQAASNLHPEILAAMKRDLGLNAEQATARVARDLQATNIIDQVRGSVGQSFAGAWIDGDNVFVGVTDHALKDGVAAAGATPVVMNNSLDKLNGAKSALDGIFVKKGNAARAVSDNASIASYFVDVTSNKLIIEALADGHARAQELASQAGLAAGEYEVHTVDALPKPLATVRGGDAYWINNQFVCSVGFSVNGGFVSAGHCGAQGASVTVPNGPALGTFAGSTFPGDADMSYIKTVSGTTLKGTINGYGSSDLPVSGSTEAAIGASICRSGQTTGVHCGKVSSKNATVNYGADGSVTGLTKTTVCAEHGDSGGSFYSGAQAQGVTSGGSGDCTSGGTTYFQPVNEILSAYGLTLVKS
ncbi:hypothetical protein VHEMI10186 [[Torrubiella] hemipterigena]|uniref:Peptidase S1A alpha-lytic prodomain domain-containing protein n=1 Tax=[Torrubiella] hemipterigena TaxID=1531966 RepID=A0A0A1TI87_9HYPO|nr:hypothetical protein VHEMI10186 [[Torrubiella] hemipterigena]